MPVGREVRRIEVGHLAAVALARLAWPVPVEAPLEEQACKRRDRAALALEDATERRGLQGQAIGFGDRIVRRRSRQSGEGEGGAVRVVFAQFRHSKSLLTERFGAGGFSRVKLFLQRNSSFRCRWSGVRSTPAEPILQHPHPLVFGATGGCFSFTVPSRRTRPSSPRSPRRGCPPPLSLARFACSRAP